MAARRKVEALSSALAVHLRPTEKSEPQNKVVLQCSDELLPKLTGSCPQSKLLMDAGFSLRSGGGGLNLGSTWIRTFLFFYESSNLGSTWVLTFGRVRVVPGFRELNIEPGFNLGSHWVPFNLG